MRDRISALRLSKAWDTISSLPIRQRKCVVLLCRAQEVIFNDEYNLLCIQTDLTSPPTDVDKRHPHYCYYQFALAYQDWIRSPVMSSILLDFCRSTPMSPSDIEDCRLKSWGKEYAVCDEEEDYLSLDYSCWFDPTCHSRPLVAGTPPNPRMAMKIHDSLLRWRANMESTLLFPRMSRKLVSRDTISQWERFFDREWVLDARDGGIEMTQETLERVYHQHGVRLEGMCEIRQKWYKSGLTPRTYFCQGGTSYRLSCYIQGVASGLTAQIPTTHPISRLNPARIRLGSPSHYLRIYDLTSFTSNHWECKHFLRALAAWSYGHYTTVFDAREGPIQVDLGVLISTYNQMNDHPRYSLERIDPVYSGVSEHHNRAGFLGVYGNINFSTALHGMSLLMAVDSFDEANVAGDDAHYSEQSGLEYVANRLIRANGKLEETKCFRSDEDGAVALKRGVEQIGDRVLPKLMALFPSFSNLGVLYGYEPPQFPSEEMTRTEKVSLVGNEIFRFLRSIFFSQISQDLEIAHDLLRSVYETAHLPKYGQIPPYGKELVPVLPDTYDDYLSISPLEALLHNHFSEGVVLPVDQQELGECAIEDPCLVAGGEWCGVMTQYYRYLGVLEYVVAEEMTELVFGEVAYERMSRMYSGSVRQMYRFTCVCDVPANLLVDTGDRTY